MHMQPFYEEFKHPQWEEIWRQHVETRVLKEEKMHGF